MSAAHDTQALADAAFLDWRSRRPHGGATARDELCFRDGYAAALASRLQEQEGQPALSEREQFEAWVKEDRGDLRTFGSGPNMHYRNSAVNQAWTGWHRRATLAAGSQAVQVPGWSGWACQYPGKLPRLYGAREIAELNLDDENGDRLLFVKEVPHD